MVSDHWCIGTLTIICIFGQLVNFSLCTPQIFWDPYHPLFQCDDPILTVKSGDLMKFICPDVELSQNPYPVQKELFESASLLNFDQEEDYKNCNASVRNGIVVNCQASFKVFDHSVQEFTPKPTALKFIAGNTYYVVGTSFRSEIRLDDRIGGSCNTTDSPGSNKLRLKIRVCTLAEISSGECVPCDTEACMYKDCKTNCSSWTFTESFVKDGKCYTKDERNCTKMLLNTVVTESREIEEDCGRTCTDWFSISNLERDELCYDLQKRSCNISFLSKTNTIEYQEEVTGCKITTPTGAPRKGSNDEDADTFKILLIIVTLVVFLVGIVLGGCIHRYHHKKKINNNYESSSSAGAVRGKENRAYTDSIIMNELPAAEHQHKN